MITFEINKEKDELEVHLNDSGIDDLIKLLQSISKTKSHEHLMTPSWGGEELSEEKQNPNNTILNKVTLYAWSD